MNHTPPPPAPATWALLTAYFMIYVVWGSTYFVIGRALEEFPPFLLGGLRFTAAGLLLLIFCQMRGERIFRARLVKKSAVSGIVLLFIDMTVIMLAQRYLSSSLVAILASSTLLWILALDIPMWKTHFGMWEAALGVVVGLAGVGLLTIEQLAEHGDNVRHAIGVVLLVCGCITWALGTLYTKYRSNREEEVGAFAGAAWQMTAAGGVFLVVSCVLGEEVRGGWGCVDSRTWTNLLYLIVFGSLLAYTSYIWLLKVRPAEEVGTHAYVNPVVAVALGTAAGGETIGALQVAGLGCILASIYFIRKAAARLTHGSVCRRTDAATPFHQQ